MEIPARSQPLAGGCPRGSPGGPAGCRGRAGSAVPGLGALAERGQRLLGRGFPDGAITALLLAGISVGSKYLPPSSPINLALFYRVWETYHSKCVLLSCLGARHLLIPFLSYGVWNSRSLGGE